MEYRLRRQLIIASIFFAIIFIAIGFWLFSKREIPSCFDKKLNQGEERVDCGGPCAACSELYFEDLKVINSGFLRFNGAYDAYAQIKNANSQHGAEILNYGFKFYDEEGNFISEKKGRSYVLAGQTRYLIESNLTLEKKPGSVKFEIIPMSWEKQDRGNIKLPIFSKKYEGSVSPEYSGLMAQVTGILENQSDYSFAKVDLVAILLDEKGDFLSIGKTEIDELRAGDRRDFTIPWFSELREKNVANVYIEATTNVFDDANILR